MQLTVEGQIHNDTDKIQPIPNIVAAAKGADGKLMQSWQIDAPALSRQSQHIERELARRAAEAHPGTAKAGALVLRQASQFVRAARIYL